MLILASKSPRRKELLGIITDNFKIMSVDADETLPEGIGPQEAVLYLSKIKAMPLKNDSDVIIGADTVVAVDGSILGKPADDGEAFEMLRRLSGREHSVFTGVTLVSPRGEASFFEKTNVRFYRLSDEEIRKYIETGECRDKAGAYGIQGRGSLLVEKIDGDYFNVVGLPVAHLYRELKKLREFWQN